MNARLAEVQPVLMASDVKASIRFYQRLGFTHIFSDDPTSPRYAAVRRDAVELHLQWHDARDLPAGDRPVIRFLVPAVDDLSAEFASLAPDLDRTDLRDTPWGTREFHVRDPDRNGLHFYRPL